MSVELAPDPQPIPDAELVVAIVPENPIKTSNVLGLQPQPTSPASVSRRRTGDAPQVVWQRNLNRSSKLYARRYVGREAVRQLALGRLMGMALQALKVVEGAIAEGSVRESTELPKGLGLPEVQPIQSERRHECGPTRTDEATVANGGSDHPSDR